MSEPHMKLALVGYGKMGKMIDQLAGEYGFQTVLRLDETNNTNFESFTREKFQGVDVAIEFSTPEVVIQNIRHLLDLGVPTVVGTTGWTDRLGEVRAIVAEKNGALLWSPNFSVGVNVFFRLVAEAAKLLASEDEYEAYAYEIHHSAKKDAPSGTALKLVEDMKAAGYAKNVDVSSNRAGKVPGTHEIGFDSAADTITLRHTARSREGFARGALKAAQWIVDKKGLHEFSDVIFDRRKNV